MGLFSLVSFVLVNSLGNLYPVYLSYKAIKNHDPQPLEVLLMFWIVMGLINTIESTFGWFLHWIPFFYQFKTGLMLWLTLPQIQGSTYVYVTYIHPFFLAHEAAIDKWLADTEEAVRRATAEYFHRTVDQIKDSLMAAVASASQSGPPPSHTEAPTLQSTNDENTPNRGMGLLQQIGPLAFAAYSTSVNLIKTSNYKRIPSKSSLPDEPSGYQIPDYDDETVINSSLNI